MRGFVIGLVLLFAVFTFVGAMGQTPPSSSKTEASR
jgi:hypothetical protein